MDKFSEIIGLDEKACIDLVRSLSKDFDSAEIVIVSKRKVDTKAGSKHLTEEVNKFSISVDGGGAVVTSKTMERN